MENQPELSEVVDDLFDRYTKIYNKLFNRIIGALYDNQTLPDMPRPTQQSKVSE